VLFVTAWCFLAIQERPLKPGAQMRANLGGGRSFVGELAVTVLSCGARLAVEHILQRDESERDRRANGGFVRTAARVRSRILLNAPTTTPH